MTARIYLFPGQGCPQRGRSAALFDRFRELTEQASVELGYSVEALCLDDPLRRLDLREFAQPVFFVVNTLNFLDLLMDDGRLPHFVAGDGLGEYSALFTAGVFDFPTGLRLVRERARLAGPSLPGSPPRLESAQIFASFLEPLPFAPPRLPVLSNVTARPHEAGTIKQNLVRQFTEPSRWVDGIRWLLSQSDARFTEVGPGTGLVDSVDRIREASRSPWTGRNTTTGAGP